MRLKTILTVELDEVPTLADMVDQFFFDQGFKTAMDAVEVLGPEGYFCERMYQNKDGLVVARYEFHKEMENTAPSGVITYFMDVERAKEYHYAFSRSTFRVV